MTLRSRAELQPSLPRHRLGKRIQERANKVNLPLMSAPRSQHCGLWGHPRQSHAASAPALSPSATHHNLGGEAGFELAPRGRSAAFCPAPPLPGHPVLAPPCCHCQRALRTLLLPVTASGFTPPVRTHLTPPGTDRISLQPLPLKNGHFCLTSCCTTATDTPPPRHPPPTASASHWRWRNHSGI